MMEESKGPILHVLVVGFHHKKGCQVEYSFPPLVPDSPNECPPGWKYLPTLALPDGSHNYDDDTAFFHLPSLTNPKKTVYGISCFRQIPVEKLKNRTDDITRGTVQKSVCVLSSLPLYGHIEVKMALITHAYFDEGDFSKVSLLEDTYRHLNACLMQNNTPLQNFVGLSARDFILQWKHKAVLLYKLLLLERRLIFFKSPVQPLCTTILTLLSLHPGMIEKGLEQSACIKLSRPMSPMPDFEDESYENCPSPIHQKLNDIKNNVNTKNQTTNDKLCSSTRNSNSNRRNDNDENAQNAGTYNNDDDVVVVVFNDGDDVNEKSDKEKCIISSGLVDQTINLDLGERNDEKPSGLQRDSSMDTIADSSVHHNHLSTLTNINIEYCGIPLPLFTQGYLCLPYLSLPYIDLLGDVNVRGYVVGATNILFKQKRQLADVLIEIDGARIESQDPDLRKQLHLTTEDLRFADFVVKHVSEEKHDVFLDGVGWEGGDEWIRAQFRVYLLCLLRTSLLQDGSREIEHFNSSFMSAWKDTHNYKMWVSSDFPGILEVNPGHPFAGQLSVADMKLRFAHTMQNTESGRKLNQAMASTGRAVATTGRAVGGAFSQAKGALTNWWSNFLVSPDNRPAICEGEDIVNALETSNDDTNTNIPAKENGEKIFANIIRNNVNNSEENIPECCESVEKNQIISIDQVPVDDKKQENNDNINNIPYESEVIHTV